MDRYRDPIRIIALPFAGDTWAQVGAQGPVPADVPRLRCTGEPLRIRVVGYDGIGPDADPVTGTTTTFDFTVVKLREDRFGKETIARTVSLVEALGAEQPAGHQQMTEDDVSNAEIIVLGFPSVTTGDSQALHIFLDAGARVLQ